MKAEQSVSIKRGFILPAAVLASVCLVSACSSDKTADEDPLIDDQQVLLSDPEDDSPAAALARSVLNNGYYLSRVETFGSDGSSFGGYSYSLNTDENRIEARDLSNETVIDSYYNYDENGDLESISFLSNFDVLAPVGQEFLRVEVDRKNGRLDEITLEYKAGNEEDTVTSYTYDASGRIDTVSTEYLDSGSVETQQYSYEDGRLLSITGNDVELPGVIRTETITRDSRQRVSLVTTSYDPPDSVFGPESIVYLYDENGNVSEEQFLSQDGSITLREVYTYEPTIETVFNLTNYNIYFAR